MYDICIELIKGSVTLAAVVFGSFIGLHIYFRQKEYELVKQRYLEDAIDVVAAQLDDALGVVRHNYMRSLQLSKSLRDAEGKFDVDELRRGFMELNVSNFQQVAHHRIGILLNSKVVWNVYQLAMAYASTANGIIAHEVPEAIRLRCNASLADLTTDDYKILANKLADLLEDQHREGFKYYELIDVLNTLGRILEAEKLNLKAIGNFNKRPKVKQIVERLDQSFIEDIEPK